MIRSLLLGLIFAIGLLTTLTMQAQTNDWRSYIEQLAQEMDEGEMDGMSIDNMFQELHSIGAKPYEPKLCYTRPIGDFSSALYQSSKCNGRFFRKEQTNIYCV